MADINKLHVYGKMISNCLMVPEYTRKLNVKQKKNSNDLPSIQNIYLFTV